MSTKVNIKCIPSHFLRWHFSSQWLSHAKKSHFTTSTHHLHQFIFWICLHKIWVLNNTFPSLTPGCRLTFHTTSLSSSWHTTKTHALMRLLSYNYIWTQLLTYEKNLKDFIKLLSCHPQILSSFAKLRYELWATTICFHQQSTFVIYNITVT